MVVRSAKAGRWAWPSRTTTTGSSWATSPRTGTGTSSTRTLTSLHVSLGTNRQKKKSIKSEHTHIIQSDSKSFLDLPQTNHPRPICFCWFFYIFKYQTILWLGGFICLLFWTAPSIFVNLASCSSDRSFWDGTSPFWCATFVLVLFFFYEVFPHPWQCVHIWLSATFYPCLFYFREKKRYQKK